MYVKTLGGLALEGFELGRKKPLLLLAYLAIEGRRSRRELAELFWLGGKDPRDSLGTAVRRLNRAMPSLFVPAETIEARVHCDALAFQEAAREGDHREALDRYKGPFLDGLSLPLGSELEEWLYRTRERYAVLARRTHLRAAHTALERGDWFGAICHSESALDMRHASPFDEWDFNVLCGCLKATESPRLTEAARLAMEAGMEFTVGGYPGNILRSDGDGRRTEASNRAANEPQVADFIAISAQTLSQWPLMTTFVRPDDSRLAWQGAISLERTSDWVAPWRLPVESLQLYPFEELHEQAAKPAGVRVTFRSNARSLVCQFQPIPADSPARLDLTARGVLLGSVAIGGRERAEFNELPPGEKLLELWLPQNEALRLTGLELEEGATLAPRIEERSRRWISYGSSITQCQGADSPAKTWPGLVARKANLNLTCLGFSGQCHIEPMLARLIRDQPADMISLCLGVNVQGGSSLSLRTFRPAVLGFTSIVRDRHRSAPLALISPIYSPERESTPNEVGLTLEIMREEIQAAVEALRGLGDEHVYYVDGLELLGKQEGHLLPDDLHPNQEGYELIAQRFLDNVLPRLV